MEKIPQFPMITIPMRRNAGTPDFKGKLLNFITQYYSASVPHAYTYAIGELGTLRTRAILLTQDSAQCSSLKKYFCQLNYLKSKFPLHERGAAAVLFYWYGLDDVTVESQSDIDFEMLCIMYNIGALHTQLAAQGLRSTSSDVMEPSIHFQSAAWAFQYLRQNYSTFYSPDISPNFLSILKNICLAQAQECLLQKCFLDNKKYINGYTTIEAALQIVEYYQLISRTCDHLLKNKEGYSDNLIRTVKRWKKLGEVRVCFYSGVTFLYRGFQSEMLRKWGERITLLRAANDILRKALELDKTVENTDSMLKTLDFAKNLLEEMLLVAEKENNYVVPQLELNTITPIKGVSLVKAIPFKFEDSTLVGRYIFDKLNPLEDHKAYFLYSIEKAKILSTYSVQVEERNESLEQLFIEAQLDHLELYANELPQELTNCNNALKASNETLSDKINNLFEDIKRINNDLNEVFRLEDCLEIDEITSNGFSAIGYNLVGPMQRFKEERIHQQDLRRASEMNKAILAQLQPHTSNLNILMKPSDEILKHLDSSAPAIKIEQGQENIISEVRGVYEKIVDLRIEREILETKLRASIRCDDITRRLVVLIHNTDLESIFKNELTMHEKFTRILDKNLMAQHNIRKELREATAKFTPIHTANIEIIRKRTEIVQSLLLSFEVYEELFMKWQANNKLCKSVDNGVTRLLNCVRTACHKQDEDKKSALTATPVAYTCNNNYSGGPASLNFGINGSSSKSFLNPNSSFSINQNLFQKVNWNELPPMNSGLSLNTTTKFNNLAHNNGTQNASSKLTQSSSSTSAFVQPVNDYLTTGSYGNTTNAHQNRTNQVINSQNTVSPLYNYFLPNMLASILPKLTSASSPQLPFQSSLQQQAAGFSHRQIVATPFNNNGLNASSVAQNSAASVPVGGQSMWIPTYPSMHPQTHSSPYQQNSSNNLMRQTYTLPLKLGQVKSTVSSGAGCFSGSAPLPGSQTSLQSYFHNVNSGLSSWSGIFPNSSVSAGPSMLGTATPATTSNYIPAISFLERIRISAQADDGSVARTIEPYKIKSTPASPPKWAESLTLGIQTLSPFYKIVVNQNSEEYTVLSELITCARITKIERVVNTELWKKFTNTRRDILCSKSDDLELLQSLGVDDMEIHQKAHINMNFDKDSSVMEYSDNVALLFHCTRGNIDAVLSQGLDERLGNSTGLLGRGIYFADDPQKSMSYDSHNTLMIFAVYLGDCYSVDHLPNRNTFVREPEKTIKQKRNHSDLFFDSIVGRPGTSNEYVIYNRYQCCPFYVISYAGGGINTTKSKSRANSDAYTEFRTKLPPFAWVPYNKKSKSPNNQWPFFAQVIFNLMTHNPDQVPTTTVENVQVPSTQEIEEAIAEKLSTLADLGFTDDQSNLKLLQQLGYNLERTIDHILNVADSTTIVFSPTAHSNSLATSSISSSSSTMSNINQSNISKIIDLVASGVNAAPPPVVKGKKRKAALGLPKLEPVVVVSGSQQISSRNVSKKSKFSAQAKSKVNSAVTSMGTGSSTATAPQPFNQGAAVVNNNNNNGKPAVTSSSSTISPSGCEEDCPICCVEYSSSPEHWKVLNCTHKLCNQCYSRIETKGTTMSGQNHTFLKCPFCQSCSGVEIGTCPNGSMHVMYLGHHLPGHELFTSIQIQYIVSHSKYSLNRIAYLPNNQEGNRVLDLLRTAWDRRLCFTIGSSMTTGQQDVLVWNIHHKTSITGGIQTHGYPDPTYLDRVLDELNQYGIV